MIIGYGVHTMNRIHKILLILGIVLLIPGATALSAGDISVATDTPWLIAGSDISSERTSEITVTNSSPGIQGVWFSSSDSSYGAVGPLYVDRPPYSTTFTAGTRSGTAEIEAHVSYINELGDPAWQNLTCQQEIDHNDPVAISSLSFDPSNEVTVYTPTNITMRMVDNFGNVVDNRKDAEEVEFVCSFSEGSGLFDGSSYENSAVTIPVDSDGNFIVRFRTATVAGENVIWANPGPLLVPDRWITVYGIGDALPASIEVTVSPNSGTPPNVPADGISKFYLTYTLMDEFGNPSGGCKLKITTSVSGESYPLYTSNSNGQVILSYGPRDSTGVITIC